MTKELIGFWDINDETDIDELADTIFNAVNAHVNPLWVRCTGEEFGCGGWFNILNPAPDCVDPDPAFILDPFWVEVERLASDEETQEQARILIQENGVEYEQEDEGPA